MKRARGGRFSNSTWPSAKKALLVSLKRGWKSQRKIGVQERELWKRGEWSVGRGTLFLDFKRYI